MPNQDNDYRYPEDLLVGADRPRQLPLAVACRGWRTPSPTNAPGRCRPRSAGGWRAAFARSGPVENGP